MFGFEYIKIKQIEEVIFQNSFRADVSFYLGAKMCTEVLEQVKNHFKSQDYFAIQLGIYANGENDKLIVFTELIDEEEYNRCHNSKILREKGNMDINNYYDQKNRQGTLSLKKFEFQFYFVLNNVQSRFFYQNIRP